MIEFLESLQSQLWFTAWSMILGTMLGLVCSYMYWLRHQDTED
jgi:ABC-type amino acid transport system permease subunit